MSQTVVAPARLRTQRQWSILAWRYVGRLLTYLVILGIGAFVSVPFIWMLSASLKDEGQIFASPPIWIPSPIHWHNYPEAMALLPFGTFLKNSVIVTGGALIGEVLSCSLVAYGFARLRFPGKGPLFICVLATILLPVYAVAVPRFILFRQLGWTNTLLPLTVPAFFGGSAFFIFLFRQFFLTIPFELEDAARIDGASTLTCYSRIILPMSKPVLGAVAIFSFVFHWNDFFFPRIFIQGVVFTGVKG
jgi:ABC-type glycerol-3-phosphate transport system permease component